MKQAVKHTLALAAVAMAAQASAQVTFYEREGFQGESFTTRRQIGDLGRFGFNDSASSVVVGGDSGDRWQVCEDVRFNGRCVIITPGQYPTLRAMGLNNRISSVQAMARVNVAAPVVAAPPVPRGRVVFYEKEDFSGRSMVSQDDISNLGPTGFDDRVSSIEVIGGSWEICQGGSYSGPCAVLRPGQYPSLRTIGFNNSISSLRASGGDRDTGSAARVIFYEEEGLSGRSFVSQGDVADFSRFGFNNRASSVEVVGGWFEVCQGVSYAGQCVLLRPGKYPSLTAMGMANRISSARVTNGNERAQETRVAPVTALYDPRRRANEQLYEANVVAVRAVVGPPEQRCWIERDQVSVDQNRNNVPATIFGAVIGGILGHQVGNGRGRDLATVGGAIAGGAVGNSLGGNQAQAQTQDLQRCTTVPSQARPELYDVTYSFRGMEHRVQMTNAPGPTITVNQEGEPRV